MSESFWLDLNHSPCRRKWRVCWLPRSTVKIPSQAKDVVSYLQISCQTHCTTGLVACFFSQNHAAKAKFLSFSFIFLCCLYIKVEKCNLWYWVSKESGTSGIIRTVPVQVRLESSDVLSLLFASLESKMTLLHRHVHCQYSYGIFPTSTSYKGSSSVRSQCDTFYLPDISPDGIMHYAALRALFTTNLADLSVWYVLFTFKNAYSRISHGCWDFPVLEKTIIYWKLCSLPLSIADLVWKIRTCLSFVFEYLIF